MRPPTAPAERDHLFVSSKDPLPKWKRTIDIGCCIIALPFLVAAMGLLALVHAATSPGSLFFRQERVGYMGRRFTLFKFRTMHAGADVGVHQSHVADLVRSKAPLKKMDATGDSRLVPLGWIMRATGLDELPQIINVLRGEMSIVGPRPCIPYEYEQYAPWHRARFNAVPGLTGLWQVSGKNRTTFDEMIQLDIRYCETKSLLQDLRIIAFTVPALWIQVLDTRTLRRKAKRATPRPAHIEHADRPGTQTAATFQTWNPAP